MIIHTHDTHTHMCNLAWNLWTDDRISRVVKTTIRLIINEMAVKYRKSINERLARLMNNARYLRIDVIRFHVHLRLEQHRYSRKMSGKLENVFSGISLKVYFHRTLLYENNILDNKKSRKEIHKTKRRHVYTYIHTTHTHISGERIFEAAQKSRTVFFFFFQQLKPS